VNSPWFGTLPDFGNFPAGTDRPAAIGKMMPWSRGVSVKGDAAGIDAVMKVVLDAGFRGFAGIESEGDDAEDEPECIRAERTALESVLAKQPVLHPLFNGRDLTGWEKVAGGDWAVED